MNDARQQEPRGTRSPVSHYRFWAAFRGILCLVILAMGVTLIPLSTPWGLATAAAATVLLAPLGIRWLYAATSGRLSQGMRRTLDKDDGAPL